MRVGDVLGVSLGSPERLIVGTRMEERFGKDVSTEVRDGARVAVMVGDPKGVTLEAGVAELGAVDD